MSTLQERIAEIMKETGLTVGKIATAAGVSSSAVSQWKMGLQQGIRAEPAMRLEELTGYNARWIISGEGRKKNYPASSSPAEMSMRRVPLINSVQAGVWTEICDSYALDETTEWLLTNLKLSDSAFALKIKGKSMLPDFQEGDRIIIDPKVSPTPGDFVVASNSEHEATFKKYRIRGIDKNGNEIIELVPLNPDFPTLRSDETPITIIGKMMEFRRYYDNKEALI